MFKKSFITIILLGALVSTAIGSRAVLHGEVLSSSGITQIKNIPAIAVVQSGHSSDVVVVTNTPVDMSCGAQPDIRIDLLLWQACNFQLSIRNQIEEQPLVSVQSIPTPAKVAVKDGPVMNDVANLRSNEATRAEAIFSSVVSGDSTKLLLAANRVVKAVDNFIITNPYSIASKHNSIMRC